MRMADKTDKTDKKRRTGEQPPALLTLKNREPFPLILRRDYQLLILCLPAIIYMIIFDYGPIWGLQIAFKRFLIGKTIANAEWVGLENFIRFLEYPYFWRLLKNTLVISLFSLLIPFPMTILFALVINTSEARRMKQVYQTIIYAPHFISVVVMVGMLYIFGSPQSGIINIALRRIGLEPIFFMAHPIWVIVMLVGSHVWQQCGWSSIIYLATLHGVPPELHESAMIDGASRWKRVLYIDIPSIIPTMVLILILRIGQLLSLDWQKILLVQNNLNIRTTEIIQTYVYKSGILQGDYSYATAAGMFIAVVNLILIVSANSAAKGLRQQALW